MTTKLKKLLTSLLAFSLVLGMLPMGTMASAAANITDGDITVVQYRVPDDNVSALEAYARTIATDISDRSVTKIRVKFTDGSRISLSEAAGTWSATISNADGHQPSNVASIQLEFKKLPDKTVFVTIGADQLQFVNHRDTLSYTEISLVSDPPASPAVYHSLSVSYVFPGKEKPGNKFIDYVEYLEAGDSFTVKAVAAPKDHARTVAVDGIEAEVIDSTLSGTMPEGDVTVTFTYTPVEKPVTEYLTFEYVKPAVANVSDAPEGIHVPDPIPAGDGSGNGYRYKFAEVGFHSKSDSAAIPDGYAFTGWFLEKTCEKKVEDNHIVSYDDTLYGYWTKPEEPIVPPPVETPVTPPSPSYSYYRATVRYLALDTNAVLADAYSTDTIREGRSYDVSEQAALAISGYTIDHVEGATSGTLNGNVTVTVWYSAETVLENPDVPLVDVPEVPPTTPPAPDASGETDEVILVDPETPLGDLPQTGIVAEAADPASTLGFAALAAAMAMAGLAVTLNRKREDAE
ncbi:MAG: MucBP domain-containing protein [Oscillospiraceae bacterium]